MENSSTAVSPVPVKKGKNKTILLIVPCVVLILAVLAFLYFYLQPLRVVRTAFQVQQDSSGQVYTAKKQVFSYAGAVENGFLYYVQTYNKAPESEGVTPEAEPVVCLQISPSSDGAGKVGASGETDEAGEAVKAGETGTDASGTDLGKDWELLKKRLDKRADGNLYWQENTDGSVTAFFPLSASASLHTEDTVPFRGDIRYMIEDDGFSAEESCRSAVEYTLVSGELTGSLTYTYSVTPYARWEEPGETAEAGALQRRITELSGQDLLETALPDSAPEQTAEAGALQNSSPEQLFYDFTGAVTAPEGVTEEQRGRELRAIRQILDTAGISYVLGAPVENPKNILIRIATEQNRVASEQNQVATEQNRIMPEQNRITLEQTMPEQNQVATEQNRITSEQDQITPERNQINSELLRAVLNNRSVALYTEYPADGSILSTDPSALTAEVKENRDGSVTLEIRFNNPEELRNLTEHILVSDSPNRIILRFTGSEQDILEASFDDIITDGVLRFTAIPFLDADTVTSEYRYIPALAAALLSGTVGSSESYRYY